MPDSDWSGDSEAVEADLVGAINSHFVAVLSRAKVSPRPTQRRRSKVPSDAARGAGNSSDDQRSLILTSTSRGKKRPRINLHESMCTALRTGGSGDALSGNVIDRVATGIVHALKVVPDRAEVAHLIFRSLSDPLNTGLRESVLAGLTTPSDLVAMDEESLLNPETREERQRQRRERLEQKTVAYVESLTSTVTHLFACPSCGGRKCHAQFRSTDFVKWHGDDPTPTLLTCVKCSHSFRQ